LPIKGTLEETKSKHCLTLTHLKYVDEYRQREKHIALRKEREEAAKNAVDDKDSKGETTSGEIKQEDDAETTTTKEGDNEDKVVKDEAGAKEGELGEKEEKEGVDHEDEAVEKEDRIGGTVEPSNEAAIAESESKEQDAAEREINESMEYDENDDEDEIELHAGDEVEEDLSMDDDSGWSRRTRSAKTSTDRKTSN